MNRLRSIISGVTVLSAVIFIYILTAINPYDTNLFFRIGFFVTLILSVAGLIYSGYNLLKYYKTKNIQDFS